MTEGTKVLWREVMPDKLPPEVVARGRARAMEPDVVERIGASLRGKPAHPNTRAALLEAAKRPKSPEHRQKISEANYRRWRKE